MSKITFKENSVYVDGKEILRFNSIIFQVLEESDKLYILLDIPTRKQCQTIIKTLEHDYSKQLEYDGALRDIYDTFKDTIRIIEKGESLNEVDFSGFVRMFVDETTDFTNPLIKEIEKVEDILNDLQELTL